MSFLIKTAIKIKGSFIYNSFERFAENPKYAQEKLLKKILSDNSSCEYGKKYGFSSVKGPREYAEAAPIVSYTGIAPYIDRMKKGERNVLTEGKVFIFFQTSGTTSSPKYIPCNRVFYSMFADTSVHWLYRAIKENPGILDGYNFGIANPAVYDKTGGGIDIGSSSGLVRREAASFLGDINGVPEQVGKISDYDLKYYLMMRFALPKNITFMVTPAPVALINAALTAKKFSAEIIKSIYDGILFPSGLFTPAEKDNQILASLRGNIKPDKKSAAFIDAAAEKDRGIKPGSCWKNLKLAGCWLSSTIGFRAPELKKYYGDIALRDIGYVASEGACSIPYANETPGCVLAVHNNYYEFIPESETGSANPRVLRAHQLEKGRCYKVLITNPSGLYRYDINDIIRVAGFYSNTPLIQFERKSDDTLNISGEKMNAGHVVEAADEIRRKTGKKIRQLRLVPDIPGKRYLIYICPEPGMDEKYARNEFIPLFDSMLRKMNCEYEVGRKEMYLNPPVFYMMKQEWEEDVRKLFVIKGNNDVQFKWKIMSPEKVPEDEKFIEYSYKL